MISLLGWSALAVAALLLDLLARRSERLSTLAQLGRRLVSGRVGTLLFFLAWAFVGWHLFSRYTLHPV